MKSSVSNIKLTSVDDLFKTDETRADEIREKVMNVPMKICIRSKTIRFKSKIMKSFTNWLEV